MKKKRKIITTSLAAVLAVALLTGGTIAYLSDSSETVTNKFNTNEIDVDLDESGDQEYEIIPGTSEEKDPTITITSTVDSYLYVLVYGNNPVAIEGTDGADDTNYITYAIAEGWTALAYNKDLDSDNTNDSYTDETLAYFGVSSTDLATTTEITIYYREAEASDDEQVFHVLENDVVSYSSEITDLSDYADGEIYLAFAAYAIQQKPFSNAADALTQTVVSTPEGLTEAISNGEPVTLSGDISLSATELNTAIAAANENDTAATIDLNGATLTVTDSTSTVLDGAELYLTNGVLDLTTTGNDSAIAVEENATLTLENMTVNTGSAINVESNTNKATINVINSIINSTGYYCVTTNAAVQNSGTNVVINIENSELTATDSVDAYSDSAAVLFNIPGTLNITNSTLTGQRQGVIVRCGTANITDSIITTTAEYTGGADHLSANWGSGNEVPMAALVAGDRSSAYPGDVTVTLDGVTLTVSSNADTIPAIYLSTDSNSTTVTGAATTETVLVNVGTGTITINNTTVGSGVTSLTTVSELTTA